VVWWGRKVVLRIREMVAAESVDAQTSAKAIDRLAMSCIANGHPLLYLLLLLLPQKSIRGAGGHQRKSLASEALCDIDDYFPEEYKLQAYRLVSPDRTASDSSSRSFVVYELGFL